MARPGRVSPDRILAAAAALEFAARGFAGARVDRIARRARVNKAMLYYHFGSKQRLYRALLRADLHRRRRAAAPPSPPGRRRPPTRSIAPSRARRLHPGALALSRRSCSARSPKAARTSTARRSPRSPPFRAPSAAIVAEGVARKALPPGRSRGRVLQHARADRRLSRPATPIRKRARPSGSWSTAPSLTPDCRRATCRTSCAARCSVARHREVERMTLSVPTPSAAGYSCGDRRCAFCRRGCREAPPADRVRVSGQVEATDVQVARPGRRTRARAATSPKAQRVEAGDVVARLDTADAELALARAPGGRDQADAQLRLLQAGRAPEDIRQAEAQVAARRRRCGGRRRRARRRAEADVERFEALLASNSGSRKQRDDAVARRDVARERAQAARERVRAAREKRRAGCEPGRAAKRSTPRAPASPPPTRRSRRWRRPSPMPPSPRRSPASSPRSSPTSASSSQPRAPIVVITDLDHAWANVYVDEPVVPRLRLGQAGDALHRRRRPAVPAPSASSRRAPSSRRATSRRPKIARSWSTASRSSVDNTSGMLKAGMPVEAEIPFARRDADRRSTGVAKRYGDVEARRRARRCRSRAARCSA